MRASPLVEERRSEHFDDQTPTDDEAATYPTKRPSAPGPVPPCRVVDTPLSSSAEGDHAVAAPLRVMQSFSAARNTTNPYLKQLLAAINTPECTARTFSWSAAIRGDFDVLHVHWPEVLLRGSSRPKTWMRRLAFFLVMTRIRLSRRALVRTVHNVAPHEAGPRVERALLRWCERLTTMWITLMPSTPVPEGSTAPRRTIPHGHYRDWFGDATGPAASGRLLYFGLIRPYKGVEDLLTAFGGLDSDTADLRIVGSPRDADLGRAISAAAATVPHLTARLEYVSDDELADEVSAAQLVVLPYRDMHNSGSALLALSLGRPILVPQNAVTAELSNEVGPGWVHTFRGKITATSLMNALEEARLNPPPRAPQLQAREWSAIGAAHIAAYRTSLEASAAH